MTLRYIVPHPPAIVSQVGKGIEKGLTNTMNAYLKIKEEIFRENFYSSLCSKTAFSLIVICVLNTFK